MGSEVVLPASVVSRVTVVALTVTVTVDVAGSRPLQGWPAAPSTVISRGSTVRTVITGGVGAVVVVVVVRVVVVGLAWVVVGSRVVVVVIVALVAGAVVVLETGALS